MSVTIIMITIGAAVIIAGLVVGAMALMRRRGLKRRFGQEYERVVEERHGLFKADSELADRERRVRGLGIRPLSDAARTGYSTRWVLLQELFVDAPQDATARAQHLVAAVMKERGYPTDGYDQMAADLSVEFAGTLGHYRAAHEISESAGAGEASTEDLRLAVIHYRALFDELASGCPAHLSHAGPGPWRVPGTASELGKPAKDKEEIAT